ncbi:MAG: ATP-binding protein, partial [Chloroflexota bacterium]
IEDITERRELELGLEVSKKSVDDALEYAESIISTVREPLIVLDHDLRVIAVNRSFYEFFKVKPEETVGQLVYELGNKQWDIPELRELLETILPQETTFDNYEVEHDFITIGKRSMLLNARQMQRVLGKEQVVLLAIEDITERKLAEEVIHKLNTGLEALNQDLESFTYSIAHDLRAPLRAVNGFSRILVEEFGKQLPEEAKHYLSRIQDNTNQMGSLIDDLLGFSRLGQQVVNIQSINCEEMVNTVLDNLKPQLSGRSVKISVAELPSFFADPALMKQVWINLLSNAIKFTAHTKLARIEVGAKETKQDIVYFVKDNGVGFDMRYADKLFKVFQRLHSRTEFEGTGVGLAIVQRIIARHGGRIWAEAEVDKGAAFYFTLGEKNE